MTSHRGNGRKRRLKTGDEVRVKLGGRELKATIIEDRGNIGVRGRQIVRVKIILDSGDDFSFEIPAEKVVRAA